MPQIKKNDYGILDSPSILGYLFHPRREPSYRKPKHGDIMIPVEDDVVIGGCFHPAGNQNPTILFFHGNGEIVSDYDDLGELYNRMGINFFAVDYRGYGRSSGSPTVTAMMKDCHTLFEFATQHLKKNGFTGSVVPMGRSLGSASVLELAAANRPGIDALIIESGFAYAGPLLKVLGIDPDAIGFNEDAGFCNADKIKLWSKPLLVIHAEFDHIIPFSDGEVLYGNCPAKEKRFLKIPGANHNDIFMQDINAYMTAVKELVYSVA